MTCRVAKVVEPKRQKLREAEAKLEAANIQLKDKQDALKEVIARVQSLQKQLADAQSEQRKLNDQVGLVNPLHSTVQQPLHLSMMHTHSRH